MLRDIGGEIRPLHRDIALKHYPSVYQEAGVALTGPRMSPVLPGFLRRNTRQGPRIAILLGMFNGAAFLGEQLESLARQTHANWFLSIRDDASRDDCVSVARAFARTMPGRDIRIATGAHRGFARNFLSLLADCDPGADAAAFCDQDDVWDPSKLSRALDRLGELPPGVPGLYCGRTTIVDRALKPIGASPRFTRPPSFRNALVQNIAGGNTMVMNRAALDRLRPAARYAGPLPAHDWWVYQIITGAGGVVIYDPVPTVFYRQHGRNLIGANRGQVARLRRIAALASGQLQRWSDQNLTALTAARDILTPGNRAILEEFRALRMRPVSERLGRLWALGLHRQTRGGTAALWMAAAAGRL